MWGVARAPSEARCQDDGSRACGPSQHDGYREQGTRPPQHGRRLGPTDPEAPSSRGIQRLRAREGSRGSELERGARGPGLDDGHAEGGSSDRLSGEGHLGEGGGEGEGAW